MLNMLGWPNIVSPSGNNPLAALQAENARLVALLSSHSIEWRVPPESEASPLIMGDVPTRLTTHKKEDTEQQRESLLRQILDTSSVAIFLVDMVGRITQANKRMAEMFGCSLDALIGSEYVALVHPSERDSGRQKLLALLASAIPSVDLDRLYWRADKSEFWGHLTCNRLYDAGGEQLGLVGVIADVTDNRHAELALRDSEARYRTFIANLPIGIVVAQDGLIKYANQTTVEMIGYPESELVDRAFLPFVAEADRPRLMDLHRRRMSGEAIGEIERSYVISMIRKDGVVRQWQFYVNTTDWNGHPSALGSIIDISDRKIAEEEIQRLAFYDPLTQLPNRRLLLDRLSQAQASSARSGRIGALIFIDLDNFKTLNDTLGHDKGDLLLQQVGARLITCVREGDTVARLGGDEFVVMLEDLSRTLAEAATQTEIVGEKILATFDQPYLLAGHKHRSTPSIGVTLFDGHQSSIEELLKQADLSMYQAKTAGRNTLRFYDANMQATLTARAALEDDLREAVVQQQFVLYYQPQVDGGGRVTGAEALVRWQHPQRGLVPPCDFIPQAEETGLILPLGHWVMKTACVQLAVWAERSDMSHLSISVNVSASQFHRKDFVDQVLAVLDLTGANPRRLKLELTETLLVMWRTSSPRCPCLRPRVWVSRWMTLARAIPRCLT